MAPRSDSDPDSMPDFFNDLGLSEPVDSLDTNVVEQQLVPAARKKLAMDRQQVLLSLVLMGINRLVVSDGSIKASVVFQLATTDRVAKKRTRVYDPDPDEQREVLEVAVGLDLLAEHVLQ